MGMFPDGSGGGNVTLFKRDGGEISNPMVFKSMNYWQIETSSQHVLLRPLKNW